MSTIRKSLSSGIFYTALSKYSGVFITIVIGAVLARLLTPEEFGIVALVTVFASFFNLLSDFGIGSAVVQNRTLSMEDIQSIFSFSILLGFLLSALFFFTAPLISNFFNDPRLINVSRLLSLSILFHSLSIIPKAMFRKALQFKQIGLITVGVQLFCGVVAIILAYLDFSYYAIIAQSILIGGISLTIFYLIKPIKIVSKIQFSAIKKIFRFSIFQFLFNFINYFSRNADNLLIGKLLGQAPLGLYDKAYRLMMMPVQNLTHVITPVLMPVLAGYQHDKNFVYNSYVQVFKLLAIIGFPLSVLLFFSAGDIILILYGTQWVDSIPVFKLLALTIGIQIVLSSTGAIFQTVNRTDLLFVSGLLSALLMISGISYGIFINKNLESVGYGLIGAFSINFFQTFYFLFVKALSKSFFVVFKLLKIPIIISAFVLLGMFLLSYVPINHLFLSLLVKTIVALIAFTSCVLIIPESRQLLSKIIKR